VDLAGAAELGLTIKLVARAEPAADGGVRAAVTPVALRAASPLGSTGGVTNLVEIVGEPVGRVGLRGPGAGGPATASAVLGDLLAVARGEGSTWGPLPAAEAATTVADDLDGERSWFFALGELVGAPIPTAVTDVALAGSGVAFVSRPIALAALRERLTPIAPDLVLYPVIPEV
jgi:hypothetical protein